MADDARKLVLWTVRRTLGISLAFFVFYLVAPRLWPVPPLTSGDVVTIMGVVLLGVLLGISISFFWPLPEKRGLPRAIRTAIFTIPALGIGLSVHVALQGAEATRAYWVVFALAAILGSTYFTEGDLDSDESDDEAAVDDESTVDV